MNIELQRLEVKKRELLHERYIKSLMKNGRDVETQLREKNEIDLKI